MDHIVDATVVAGLMRLVVPVRSIAAAAGDEAAKKEATCTLPSADAGADAASCASKAQSAH